MTHQKFDLERWRNLFSLEKLRKQAREFVEARGRAQPDAYKSRSDVEKHVKLMNPSGEIITSPYHLAVVEQLREECFSSRFVPTVPTDVFVFARGEPQNRCVTKVGGLPFWPKKRNWPVGKSGKPMDFVAQFCFADSTDLVGSLPGDVLLIFADGVYGQDWHEGEAGCLHFEWVDRSETSLVESADIPQRRWELLPVYGEIHRTKDYLTGDINEKEWWSLLFKKSKNPRDFFSGLFVRRALNKYHKPWCVAISEGTKIGGLPRYIQPGSDDPPGRFLCALGSVHPVYQIGQENILQRPYPFTNLEGPFVRARRMFRTADEEIPTNQLLMWGDVGSLFLFLDGGGQIRWTIQYY